MSLGRSRMTQEQLQAKWAFRIAFDFLNAHLPVAGGEDYWLKTAEDLGKACRAADSDPLAVDLLAAGYGFLERMEGGKRF